jgi:uncharacterized membrane protein YeiH
MADWWIFVTDNIGVAAAAVSGAMIAIERKLDLFGVFLLGMITALGGGILRDVLLGEVPPRFFTNYIAILIVTLMVSAVFITAKLWNGWRDAAVKKRIDQVHNLFDAIGLALFTVVGIQKTIDCDMPIWVGIIMGTMTGAAGGVIRDVLINEEPLIFRKEIYAMACVLGGIAFALCNLICLATFPTHLICGATVFLTRVLAVKHQICLPTLRPEDDDENGKISKDS